MNRIKVSRATTAEVSGVNILTTGGGAESLPVTDPVSIVRRIIFVTSISGKTEIRSPAHELSEHQHQGVTERGKRELA